MSQIPLGTQFIGLASTYQTVERRSALINNESQPYTMQDIVDTAGIPGPQGVQGPVGPAGPIGPVGPAGLTWQGAWVSGTSYILNNAVGYNGASYFCIAPTSGTTPPDLATANWALLASQGAQGATGPAGAQGPTGASGPGVPTFFESNATDVTMWNNGQGNVVSNTSFGDEALKSNSTGNSNTAIGNRALKTNTQGVGNVALGARSLEFSTLGSNNTAIGAESFLSLIGAINNTAVGSFSANALTSGNNNTAIGASSLQTLITGSSNIAIGSGSNVSSSSTSNSIVIGRFAIAGSSAVVIGTGATSATFTGGVLLGNGATATANNQFVVGSSSQAAGAIDTAAVTPTQRWKVKINGVDYYIPLETA